jgi:hypothetical protein
MQDIKITTPGPDGHYHFVYVNSETGVASISPGKDGHQHEVIFDPPREPVEAAPALLTDPTTGQQMEAPVGPDGQPDQAAIAEATQMGLQFSEATPADPGKELGSWIIGPANTDFHTHDELNEFNPEPKEKKQNDSELLEECMSLWREGLSLTSDCREKGREAEEFYRGRQWEDSTKRMLEGLDRAALTINEIGPNIDTLIGIQNEERTDFRYLPQEDGDQRVADILNVIVKKVTDACYYPREETKVFKDIAVPGFGAFNVLMNFEKTIQGEIVIERFPWDDIVYGPHEKEDLSDCEFEVRSRMYSIAKLKQMFGKKADEIETSYRQYAGQYPDIEKNDNGVSGTHTDYRQAKKIDDLPFTVDGLFPLVDVQKKQFRFAQCSRKVYKEVTVFFIQEENFFYTAYDWSDKDIALAQTIPGMQAVTQLKTRMKITKFCGNVILANEDPADLPIHDFYTVPCYGYRQNGEYWGKVEAAKDPQREINKRRSQLMDTMNRLGASVYYTDASTFFDKIEEERFKKNRSKPGSIFKLQNVNNKPALEEGANLPQGVVDIMTLDTQSLQRLMNIVPMQGGANESGTMYLEKKKGRLTGNQFLFDNLSFAKQKLGKIIVGLIQRYYPPERIIRLLNSAYAKQKFELGGQDYTQYSEQEIVELLENTDLLEYDVIVSESSFAPSTRLGIAMALFELISKGAQIDPSIPLRFIDMPADIRTEITEGLDQQAQQAAQAATDTANAEITKTVLANGSYTIKPEKADELGLVALNAPLTEAPASDPNSNTSSQATEYANNLASSLAG